MVKIVEVKNSVVPIASDIANAYIDFSKMTASVVALVTDVIRDGKPVVGYGFNSNGRYAARGLLEERFLPRLRGFVEVNLGGLAPGGRRQRGPFDRARRDVANMGGQVAGLEGR